MARCKNGTPLVERFWSKVAIKGPSDCWEWTAATNYGYGLLNVDKSPRKAHRLSYELNIGPIPEGQLVCHRCDNRRCVNPAHLFLGTHRDNTADMIAKGRQGDLRNFGNRNGRTKINPDIVRDIRSSGDTQKALASRYGIGETTVGHILARRSWAHVP